MIKSILLLGDEALYRPSIEVTPDELDAIRPVIKDLHDTLMDFRRKHGRGRAIAAPQIGIHKRIIYMHIESPIAILNPSLHFPDEDMMEVMDDCMSFPALMVWVMRYRRCVLRYRDMEWQPKETALEGDLAELIQHEYDHLDGILATMRAVDNKSFYACSTDSSGE